MIGSFGQGDEYHLGVMGQDVARQELRFLIEHDHSGIVSTPVGGDVPHAQCIKTHLCS